MVGHSFSFAFIFLSEFTAVFSTDMGKGFGVMAEESKGNLDCQVNREDKTDSKIKLGI